MEYPLGVVSNVIYLKKILKYKNIKEGMEKIWDNRDMIFHKNFELIKHPTTKHMNYPLTLCIGLVINFDFSK